MATQDPFKVTIPGTRNVALVEAAAFTAQKEKA